MAPSIRRFVFIFFGFAVALAGVCRSNLTWAADALPELHSSRPQLSVQDGDKLRKDMWRVAPDIAIDEYETTVAAGTQKTVTFLSNEDKLVFHVEAGHAYDFNIDYDGKQFHTRIVGKAMPTSFSISVNSDFAKLAAHMIATGDFNDTSLKALQAMEGSTALMRKMHLKDFDALRQHLQTLSANPSKKARAAFVSEQFSRPDGLYADVENQVQAMVASYVPPDLLANIRIMFIFGGNASGFAFSGDDVYVNLADYTDASASEIAELAAHETFHAIQAHVMPEFDDTQCAAPDVLGGERQPCGKQRALQLMDSLLAEGTASLFDYDGAKRSTSEMGKKLAKEREKNTQYIKSIISMFESLEYRLYYVPTVDDGEYDRIYGLLFYGHPNDQLGYTLGYMMARAIENKEGKPAIINILKRSRPDFILHYQALAENDDTLPKFNDDFIRFVKAEF